MASAGVILICVAASERTIGEALRRSVDRWLAVLGSGVISGLILVLVSLPFAILLLAADRATAVVLALVFLPPLAWLGARLTFATWLAADGRAPIDAVRESWRMTHGQVLRVIGWRFAYGIVIALVSWALGLVLNQIALGAAINQAIALAIEFGATIALFRKVQADARRLPSATLAA